MTVAQKENPGGDDVGQILVTMTLKNEADEDRVADGLLELAQVRALTEQDALVDTGATHLGLPASLIATLGLRLDRQVDVGTAAGVRQARVFRHCIVEVGPRRTITEVLELPDGVPALLGAIPMEAMGIEPDLHNRTLRYLPKGTPGGYHLRLGSVCRGWR
jgi:predicted aspartyl protease